MDVAAAVGVGSWGRMGRRNSTVSLQPLRCPSRRICTTRQWKEICRKYLNLRYQLLPYLYSAVAETHATGLPLMRSLWLAYPEDPKAAAVEDAYLWGDSMLVAPVLEPGATHRTTYLPRWRVVGLLEQCASGWRIRDDARGGS